MCLDKLGLDRMADLVIRHKKCTQALVSKNKLIDDHFLTYKGSVQTAWWQDPSVVVSGVVVSFALGSVVTYILVK